MIPGYPYSITTDAETIPAFPKRERTDRSIGDDSFIENAKKITSRQLKLRKPGPKPKAEN